MCRVLLVEDDLLNRMVIEDVFDLDSVKAELTCVGSAEDAVAIAPKLKPHLVLMDIKLPGIDGLEATRRLRKMPELAGARIWAVTAHAMTDERRRALQAGCDEFISKPLDLNDMHHRFKTFAGES